MFIQHLNHYFLDLLQFCHICLRECVIFLLFYLFCFSIVINTVIVTAGTFERNESGRFGAIQNLIQPTISLEIPVPSQGHYGFHSFPVVD